MPSKIVTLTVRDKLELYSEIQANLDDIEYKDGNLIVRNTPYKINLFGDAEGNVVKGFVKDGGDGEPRILTDWKGFENAWTLDEIMLIKE